MGDDHHLVFSCKSFQSIRDTNHKYTTALINSQFETYDDGFSNRVTNSIYGFKIMTAGKTNTWSVNAKEFRCSVAMEATMLYQW